MYMLYSACMGKFDLSKLKVTNDVGSVLAQSPASKTCLPITVRPIAAEAERTNHSYGAQRILVANHARGRRWYQLGGATRELRTAPHMIEIYEEGLSFDYCRWEGEAGQAVVVEFADADVQSITHGDLPELKLRTQHEVFDDQVSRITLDLAQEALNGLPNGQLYAQGLCVSLIGVMANRYSARCEMQTSASQRRLSLLQQKRVTDLIDGQLSEDLSLIRLAETVGLSTYYFVRVFKSTFGTTPHRFVQERRLEAAAAALQRDSRSSIAEIAFDHGFANQAHMTSLMRQRFGVTPRAMRR
jgi:AraC family transcriptional regulator